MMGYGNKNGRTRFGSEGDEVWTKEVRGTWNWESLPIPLVCRPPKWNMRCCFFLVFIGSHRGSQEGQRWTGLCGEMNGNQNGEQLGAQERVQMQTRCKPTPWAAPGLIAAQPATPRAPNAEHRVGEGYMNLCLIFESQWNSSVRCMGSKVNVKKRGWRG